MRLRTIGCWLLMAGLTFAVDGQAWAGPPTDHLRARVEAVIRVLEDPDLKRESRQAERRAAIRRIANEIFDFAETTRRALGPHWHGRTPPEREQVVKLFTELLERSYIGKIETYSGEKLQFGSDTIEGQQATVRTKLITKQGTEIPVDYRMHRVGDRWLAYDVSIEGVSLVANYRSQFNKIIVTSGFPALVQKLAAKQEETSEASAGRKTSQAR